MEVVLSGVVLDVEDNSESGFTVFDGLNGFFEVFKSVFLAHGVDMVLVGEVNHGSVVFEVSDDGSDEGDFLEDEGDMGDGKRFTFIGETDLDEAGRGGTKVKELGEDLSVGDGVEDEVVLVVVLGVFNVISGVDALFGSEFVHQVSVVEMVVEGGDVVSHLGEILDSHVAESSNSEDGAFVSGLDPSFNGGEDSDTGAEEGSGFFHFHLLGELEEPFSGLLDGGGESSEVVTEDSFVQASVNAKVLLSNFAVFAFSTVISQKSESDFISLLEVGDLRSYL